ncbi:CHAT domain-containing protein, partial [Nostoc sp. CHAB 5834]|nr:CHAT domain-containing protein [Nostoc sp. CHAB 5834]
FAWQLAANISGYYSKESIVAMYGIAEMSRITNDIETAQSFFERAKTAQKYLFGDFNALYIKIVNNFAYTYLAIKDYVTAENMYEELRPLAMKVAGKKSRLYQDVCYNIVNLYTNSERYTDALELLNEIEQHILEDPRIRFYPQKANLLGKTGQQRIAIKLLIPSLKLFKQSRDRNRNNIIQLEYKIASYYWKLGEKFYARKFLFSALENDLNRIQYEISFASLTHFSALLSNFRDMLNMGMLICLDTNHSVEDLKKIYDFLVKSKSLETRIQQVLKKSFLKNGRDDHDEYIEELFSKRYQLRKSYLYQMVTGKGTGEDELQYDPNLLNKIKFNEAKIFGRLGSFAKNMVVQLSNSRVTDDNVVIEFLAFDSDKFVDNLSYFVFVSLPNDELKFYKIEDSNDIDFSINEFIKSISFQAENWKKAGTFLFNRLIKPILNDLQKINHIFLITDGNLSTLPFEILPLNEAEILQDKWTISYLGNKGEIGNFNLSFGNIDVPSDPLVVSIGHFSEVPKDQPVFFSPLPFAQIEGDDINKMIKGSILNNELADKNILQLNSPEILHFCTHSFYIPFGRIYNIPLIDKISGFSDPLDRSGIALFLSNRELEEPLKYFYSGILYASEIMDWDLRTTDLVVLSSCQSGLGDIRLGDGLQGLRKAFKAAGAKSVVSSLWKVPDESTYKLMKLFYENLSKKEPRGLALRNAKQALRMEYPHPYFWAGFILDGEVSELKRFTNPFRISFKQYG